jgi:hypothetical protein
MNTDTDTQRPIELGLQRSVELGDPLRHQPGAGERLPAARLGAALDNTMKFKDRLVSLLSDFSPTGKSARTNTGTGEDDRRLPRDREGSNPSPSSGECVSRTGRFVLLAGLPGGHSRVLHLRTAARRRTNSAASTGSLPGHSRKHREQAGYSSRHSPVRPRSHEQLTTLIPLMVSMANGAFGSLATGIIQGQRRSG